MSEEINLLEILKSGYRFVILKIADECCLATIHGLCVCVYMHACKAMCACMSVTPIQCGV